MTMEKMVTENMNSREREELKQHGYIMPSYLGAGATSTVWRVWAEAGQCFAVCKISREKQRVKQEASLLQLLQHPLFPRYSDDWTSGDFGFLVMEYIPGRNVKEMVGRRGYFSWRQAVQIAIELADGLIYLHERSQPVLFRDIKPDNVIIRQDGRVKLIDLGCACYMDENFSIAGSMGYSAPEQFVREGCPGVESDVYALGKLLKFMLAGRKAEKTAWRKVPYGLRQLVEKAIRGERRERLPDMRSFLQQLTIYEGNHPFMRLKANFRARFQKECTGDFYYVQNIQRGMDR